MTRVSNFRRSSQSDEDFTRAAWDLLRDIEKSTYSEVKVQLKADLRRGVWTVETDVWVERVEGKPYSICRHKGEYPNSRAASFSAYLFAHMNTLAQMAEGAYNEWLKWGGRA